MCLKELILIESMDRVSVAFAITATFLKQILGFRQKYGCYDLMQKAMSFNDVEIVYVKGNYYRVNCLYMSKDKAINLLINAEISGIL